MSPDTCPDTVRSPETFAAALRNAGLDFQVEAQTLRYGPNGNPVENQRAIVRTDTDELLGIVGSKHALVPYSATAEALDASDSEGVRLTDFVTPEAPITFKRGAQLVFRAEVKGGRTAIRSPRTGRDEVAMHINATTSVDGSLGYRLLPSGHRVVCQNTLALAIMRDVWGFRTRHTASAKATFQGFVDRVRESLKRFAARTEAWQAMADTRISEGQFADYVQQVFTVDSLLEQAQPLAKVEAFSLEDVLSETEARAGKPDKLLEAMLDAYESAPGAEPGTAWGAYQAVSYHLTHTAGRSTENRAHSLLLGANAQRLERAESLALRMVR